MVGRLRRSCATLASDCRLPLHQQAEPGFQRTQMMLLCILFCQRQPVVDLQALSRPSCFIAQAEAQRTAQEASAGTTAMQSALDGFEPRKRPFSPPPGSAPLQRFSPSAVSPLSGLCRYVTS